MSKKDGYDSCYKFKEIKFLKDRLVAFCNTVITTNEKNPEALFINLKKWAQQTLQKSVNINLS